VFVGCVCGVCVWCVCVCGVCVWGVCVCGVCVCGVCVMCVCVWRRCNERKEYEEMVSVVRSRQENMRPPPAARTRAILEHFK